MPLDIPRKRISSIQFGLFSPNELRSASVCQVQFPDTLYNGVPKEGGLIDLRMGTTERQFLCGTCNQSSITCTGHFGHIDLVRPVFHVGYISRIKKVIETVCFYCSRIKNYDVFPIDDNENDGNKNDDKNDINKNDDTIEITQDNNTTQNQNNTTTNTSPNQNNTTTNTSQNTTTNTSQNTITSLKIKKITEKGLNFWWSLNKSKMVCMHCHSKQPLIKRDGLTLTAFLKGEESQEGKLLLNGEKVLLLLKRISDLESQYLGFSFNSKPENMIITVLNVPAICVRPSVILDGTLRGEDDLTHKLSDILKCNTNLERYEKEGAPGHIIRDYENLLQYHIATLMDNSLPGLPQSLQKSGRPLKSISARLKGKEGRVRGNLMGKRVDFSARSVISPDSNIGLSEIGVPLHIAKIHTFPEKVTTFNLKSLQKMVNNGPYKYPGANFITRIDGQKIDLRFPNNNILTLGCIVERHMNKNDYILFNRQPSLHKMSMMSHKPRIMKGRTFRLNLSTTTPYGADFDGDEMNLHMPQSYNTRTELKQLAIVNKQIISPQSNKPVMGIVQDSLIGIRLLTLGITFINEYNVQGLLYRIKSYDNEYKQDYKQGYNGKEYEKDYKQDYNEYNGNKDYNGKEYEKGYNEDGTSLHYDNKTSLHYHNHNYDNHNNNNHNNNNHNYDNHNKDKLRPCLLRPKRIFSGKQVFSFLLQNTVNFKRGNVLIKNGILLTGEIDKTIVGTSQGSLIHLLSLERYDIESFFNSLQLMVHHFLLIHGFSMGIEDAIISKSLNNRIEHDISIAKKACFNLINNSRNKKLEKQPGMSLKETFESKITSILNKARDTSSTTTVSSYKRESTPLISSKDCNKDDNKGDNKDKSKDNSKDGNGNKNVSHENILSYDKNKYDELLQILSSKLQNIPSYSYNNIHMMVSTGSKGS
ncbi:RNA polymerase II largest subunit, partial [Pseudoloma neurophilia]